MSSLLNNLYPKELLKWNRITEDSTYRRLSSMVSVLLLFWKILEVPCRNWIETSQCRQIETFPFYRYKVQEKMAFLLMNQKFDKVDTTISMSMSITCRLAYRIEKTNLSEEHELPTKYLIPSCIQVIYYKEYLWQSSWAANAKIYCIMDISDN